MTPLFTPDQMQYRSDSEVSLVSFQGGDASVVAAARVSVVGDLAALSERAAAEEHQGLIRYLMKHRHMTPFEHNSVTLRVTAPIFVYREWHRHRVWSFNEESARYKTLEPVFHIPAADRPLVNVGTSARPVMGPGSHDQYVRQVNRMKHAYYIAYEAYTQALVDGVAREVAREVLPVGIYSTMYATANLRNLFAFLSLRTHDEDATYVSYPQYEIEQAAKQVEDIVADLFPLSYVAFCEMGRAA